MESNFLLRKKCIANVVVASLPCNKNFMFSNHVSEVRQLYNCLFYEITKNGGQDKKQSCSLFSPDLSYCKINYTTCMAVVGFVVALPHAPGLSQRIKLVASNYNSKCVIL